MGIRRLHEDLSWNELKQITTAQQQENLKSLCVMNMKKTSGGHTTNNKSLWEVAHQDALFLAEQYSLYDPDLIICCGTYGLFQDIIKLPCSSPAKMTHRGICFREFGKDKILLSYSHPEARVDHALLYYGLVDAVREIFSKKDASDNKRQQQP
jgi:hypothetical protein